MANLLTNVVGETWHFTKGSARVVTQGSRGYWAWILFLLIAIGAGAAALSQQLEQGLIVTNMRDPLSWGFYIGNFAFLVGLAAAAVVLVIPAYLYRWEPIREVVLLGELMAVAAIVMCILFVTIDVGRPQMIWHMLPLVGRPNFPASLLVWDVFVLTAYFLLNYFIVTYLVYMAYRGRHYSARFILPFVFVSIPLAVSIHTVTAFLFMGLKARPFWATAILAPRFLASAFVSGPALLVLVFLVLRRVRPVRIPDAALQTIGRLLAYTLSVNLFLLGSEVFREFYAATAHTVHARFQWFGLDGGHGIAVFSWFALLAQVSALLVFLIPELRRQTPLLATGCALAFAGVYIEKGLGLLLPGMTPDTIGEVYHYVPSLHELLIGLGVWGVGALLYTLMLKVAIAISMGEFHHREGLT
jgi:molybdopterin-containing oxidoreductase family membrane subunit